MSRPLSHLALPLATIAFCAWSATPSLLDAWRIDLYARGAPIASALWLAAILFQSSRRPLPSPTPWLAAALLLCVAGNVGGLHVARHLALACSFISLSGTLTSGCLALLGAISWTPATGWFISRLIHGGLSGWERPAFAILSTLAFLALSLPKPSSRQQP